MNVKAIEVLGGKVAKIDEMLSQMVYRVYKEQVLPNLCYNNMFALSTATYTELNGKIAYGYVKVSDALYVRHAFILLEDDTVIDPMISLWRKDGDFSTYIVLKVFDTLDEYSEEIYRNQREDGKYEIDFPSLNPLFNAFTKEARPLLRAFFVE